MSLSAKDCEYWVQQGDQLHQRFISHIFSSPKQHPKRIVEDDQFVTVVEHRTIEVLLHEAVEMFANKKLALGLPCSNVYAELVSPSPQAPMTCVDLRCVPKNRQSGRLLCNGGVYFLEVMQPFTNPDGRRAWAWCLQRIGFYASPAYYMANKTLQRRIFYRGVIFVEAKFPGAIEASFCYSERKGRLNVLLSPRRLKCKAKQSAQIIHRYAKITRVAETRANHPYPLEELGLDGRCGTCTSRMPIFASRGRCRICHGYVCRQCIELASTIYPLASEPGFPLCMACAEPFGPKLGFVMPNLALTENYPPIALTDDTNEAEADHSLSFHSDNFFPDRTRALSRTDLMAFSPKHVDMTNVQLFDHSPRPQTMPILCSNPKVDRVTYSRENPCDISYLAAFK